MAQSAMSPTAWDGKRDPNPYKLEEWLLFEDELNNKETHHSSLNLTKHEIAEQVLHDIEDLGRNDTDDWLNEFPLFDELRALNPVEEPDIGGKTGNHHPKLDQQQLSPNDDSVASELHKQPLFSQDLFSVSYENAATFILSNENIFFIDDQPYVSLDPLHRKTIEEENSGKDEKKNAGELFAGEKTHSGIFWTEFDSADVKTEMAVVDEIIRNTALELDQWESDSSRSEISSDGTSVSDSSGKEKEEEDTDDPDWKPDASKFASPKRYKPYWRGGNQEEKKLRKKEQNKNAATRYRLKKKAEVKEILREEELLKEKKAKLEEKVDDIQKEIKCLKRLMRDLYKAKGMID